MRSLHHKGWARRVAHRSVSLVAAVLLLCSSTLVRGIGTASALSETSNEQVTTSADGTVGGGVAMTPDGRYLAFAAWTPEYSWQYYVYDRQTNTKELISITPDGQPFAPGGFAETAPSISADGRFVLFQPMSSGNVAPAVYLRDRTAQTTIQVSLASPTEPGTTTFAPGAMSADGSIIAYGVYNLDTQATYVYNRLTGQTTTIQGYTYPQIGHDGTVYVESVDRTGIYTYDLATGAIAPVIQDGRGVLVYEVDGNQNKIVYSDTGAGGTFHPYLWDAPTGTTTLLAASGQPLAINADGRFVAYAVSTGRRTLDINIIDTQTGETITIPGLGGNDPSGFSSDGSEFAYQARADSQIYVMHLAASVPDTTPPTVTGKPDRATDYGDWYNHSVQITWTATDTQGTATTPPATLAATEGKDVTYTSDPSCDTSGNCATGSLTLSIDSQAPSVGNAVWAANPINVGSSATLTVPANDPSPGSGVAGGEYFIGNDPGSGHALPMIYSNGSLSASLGNDLGVGVYSIGYRAQDAAGNWSPTASSILVVTDPTSAQRITGKNKKDLIPSLGHGDILPGLTSTTQTDVADYGFTVEYKNGALDSHNDFIFTYSTGTSCGKQNAQNCHSFSLNATSFDWLVVNGANNSIGQFQGVATVTADGVTTTNPFTVQGTDGDLLNPTTDDYLVVRIFAPGADPATAKPLYQASGTMAKGTSVRIQ